MNHCNRCDRDLDECQFYIHRGKPLATCKECRRSMAVEWQRANPERYHATQRKRIRTGKRKPSYNYTKHAAKAAVRREVIAGRMIKPDGCEWCGSDHGVQGHHDDHTQKLSVIWLCRKCHYQRHKQLGRVK